MKTLTLLLFLGLFSLSYSQNEVIYFDVDSYDITAEAREKLNDIATKIIDEDITSDLAVIGHTDIDASHKYNKKLSLNRAHAVRNYLLDKGVINRFHLLSRGEEATVNKNKDEDEKALNRRVEIDLNYRTNNDVYSLYDQEMQEFRLNPFEETTIRTKGGIRIDFQADSFEDVKEYMSVKVQVKEYHQKGDFLMNNLTTHTPNGQMLESGGMMNIIATQGEDTLQLKEDKPMSILFPNRKADDRMQLFSGVEHDTHMAWNQETNDVNPFSDWYGWSKTYYPGTEDTIRRSRWWHEMIGENAYRIQRTWDIENDSTYLDTTDVASEVFLNDIMQESTKLGWINCDRFYDDSRPKVDFIVQIDEDFIPSMNIVFKEVNSIMPYTYREDNRLVFANVPSNAAIQIIGLFKDKEEDKIHFASKPSSVRPKSPTSVSFRIASADEIKKQLSSL
jgi:hypothetical protein